MSQNQHINYISGVPVKISEKFKPPKIITLSTSLTQRLANLPAPNEANQIEMYDFSLEQTVVDKMTEWKKYRDQADIARKERMRLRQSERLKQIGEKQKKMLTEVSYPSADDLTSDDEESANELKPKSAELSVKIPQRQLSPTSYFDTILVPTVMASQLKSSNNKPTPITPINSKINYSDFENIMSNPFDNIELKTINDLDILAEVLNRTANIKDDDKINKIEQHQQLEQNDSNTRNEMKQNQEQIKLNDECRTAINQIEMPMQTINYYNNSNVQYVPNVTMTHSAQMYTNDYGISANRYNYNPPSTVVGVAQVYTNALPSSVIASMQVDASKSHNVPDIVKEMNAEFKNLERRRVNSENNSKAIEIIKSKETPTASPSKKQQQQERQSTVNEQNTLFRSLSGSSQKLVTNISSMGFPVERVTRITEKLGRNDKKVLIFNFNK